VTTIDDTYEHHDPNPGAEVTECRFRIVLEREEVKCTVRGERHKVHRYIAPKTGKIYRFELIDLEAP
jgi:hypothetical protein